MILLLVLHDARRRRELAAACAAAQPDVQCIEADDALQALFAAPLEQLDLVVLDGASQGPLSPAQRMHWRRMAPRSRLLLVDPHHPDVELHLHQAVRQAYAARVAGSQPAAQAAQQGGVDAGQGHEHLHAGARDESTQQLPGGALSRRRI